jgi:dTDP-4-dehydrorhamnose 3,5-epimerase-like enzyme
MNHYLLDFQEICDERGFLVSIEGIKDVPFDIKRIYYIYGNTENHPRGGHAHISLSQVIICVAGSCKIELDDGENKRIYTLNNQTKGLLVNSLLWRDMYEFSKDCVLVVLTDDVYKKEDYIYDYGEFKKITQRRKQEQ